MFASGSVVTNVHPAHAATLGAVAAGSNPTGLRASERVTAEPPGSQRGGAGEADFTGRGLSQRDTPSRPAPRATGGPQGGAGSGFQLALISRTTTAEGASTPFSRGENRGEVRLPQVVSGSGRPGIRTLWAWALPEPTASGMGEPAGGLAWGWGACRRW